MTPEPLQIGLPEVFRELQQLKHDVTEMRRDLPNHITITKDKQEEYEARLANHGTRLGDLEHRLISMEERTKPKPPWTSVASAIAAILAALVTIVTLLSLAGRIGAALGG